jgi:hypothetical protein
MLAWIYENRSALDRCRPISIRGCGCLVVDRRKWALLAEVRRDNGFSVELTSRELNRLDYRILLLKKFMVDSAFQL